MDWTDRTGPGQADMDGQNGSSSICSRPHGTVADGKKKKKKKIPDRVTLKKEIGLLSACTIIIGEAGKRERAAAWDRLSLKLCHCRLLKTSLTFKKLLQDFTKSVKMTLQSHRGLVIDRLIKKIKVMWH